MKKQNKANESLLDAEEKESTEGIVDEKIIREEDESAIEEMTEESPAEEVPTDSAETIAALKEEIEALRHQLEESRAICAQAEELREFSNLYPHVDPETIPQSVRDSMQNGIPLAAAYALYEKKRNAEQLFADTINRKNAAHSAGKAGKDTAKEFFTPDDVRGMSPEEVHTHYQKIIASMKKWN